MARRWLGIFPSGERVLHVWDEAGIGHPFGGAGMSVYDPTVGSGGMLIQSVQYVNQSYFFRPR
jgi:hypothetical protein